MPRDRFRRENPFNLRDGDLIRFRSPDRPVSAGGRAVVVGRITHIEKDPADGLPTGQLIGDDGTVRGFKFHGSAKVYRRLLSFQEMISPEPLPREVDVNQVVAGYQVRVGAREQSLWVQRIEEGYDLVLERPAQPPFGSHADAVSAQRWIDWTYPGTASVAEHVYLPVVQEQNQDR